MTKRHGNGGVQQLSCVHDKFSLDFLCYKLGLFSEKDIKVL